MAEPGDAHRLDALEIRVAHQDQVIDDLNAALTAQWEAIDRLTRVLTHLQDRLREAEAQAGASGLPEPPPPHY